MTFLLVLLFSILYVTKGSINLPFIDYAHTVEFHFLSSYFAYNINPVLARVLEGITHHNHCHDYDCMFLYIYVDI
jgi:hypothetical protein